MAVTEYDNEPIRGLPGFLPEGEEILWQGAPSWRLFLRSALFAKWIAGYFLALAVFAFAQAGMIGALGTLAGGLLALGLLAAFAWGVEKTTVYTITNRRVVLRIGVALNKCINLPLAQIGGAEMRALGGTTGDIALTLTGAHRIGYAVLWPHARPWQFSRVQPMLRALTDAEAVARLLARACAAVSDIETAPIAEKHTAPAAPVMAREAAA